MEISKAEITSAAAASSGIGNTTQELMSAEVLIKALQAEGTKYIWGYPGGAVLYIYDALYKQDHGSDGRITEGWHFKLPVLGRAAA